MNYVMNESEYNVVDKILMESHFIDALWIQQRENPWEDYFLDVEENEEITFEEGLEMIWECVDLEPLELNDEEFKTWNHLCQKFKVGIYATK